jgi:hypothetical protein
MDLEAISKEISSVGKKRDLSTVWLMPTRDAIHPRVVQSWMFLQNPPNALTGRLFTQGFKIGDGYNSGIEAIFATPGFEKFKYLLTMDDDNLPPTDGLLKLLEDICPCDEPCTEHFSVVGGLYWSKEEGKPLIFGDPSGEGFEHQAPQLDTLQECNGLPLGFTLWHLGLFRDERVPRPWFIEELKDNTFLSCDLYFMKNIRTLGYRVACDTRVKVGHLDVETGIVW